MYLFIHNIQRAYIKLLKILSNTYYKHKHYLKASPNDVYGRFESDEIMNLMIILKNISILLYLFPTIK